MNNGIESFSDASFYPAKVDHISPYLGMESELRCELFDTELDGFSDVSIDTSSVLSLNSSEYVKYKVQGNQNSWLSPEMVSLRKSSYYGDAGSTLSKFDLSESPRSSRYSDDEMSELFPFDQIRSSRTMDEEEEMLYLTELVHQGILTAEYYGECHPRTTQDSYWNMGPAQNDSDDFCPPNTLIWNNVHEKYRSNEERLLNENKMLKSQIYQMRLRSESNLDQRTPFSTNKTRRKNMMKHPEMLLQGKRQHLKRAPRKKMEVNALPSTLVSKGRQKEVNVKPFQCGETTVSQADQRIFLGGLPIGMTERTLRQHMSALGYKVLKRPKIIRGFAPEVLMRSVEEASELVERGVIMMDGFEVEVRPFNSLMKQSESKKLPNVGKRSVFLGGLSSSTTAKDIQDVMMKMGLRVINYPVIKFGYTRRVIFETVSQAKKLINMKRVLIKGMFVDVRPFVKQQTRKVIQKNIEVRTLGKLTEEK